MEFSSNVALNELHTKLKSFENNLTPIDVTVSPLGMAVILHMIADGAQGATLEQLLEFLKEPKLEDLRAKALTLMQVSSSSSVEFPDDDPSIFVFNAVLVREDLMLKKNHREFLETVYQAKVKSVDFSKGALDEVNAWVEAETNGLIKPLLLGGAFDSELLMLMHANGLYCNGKWEKEFDQENTSKDKFYFLKDNDKNQSFKMVPLMRNSGFYEHALFDDYAVLKMPYKFSEHASRKFSMTIILPKERKGLPNIVEMFKQSPHLLSSEQLNLTTKKVGILKVPRFKHTYAFIPSITMEDLGLTLPFDRFRSELHGMIEEKSVPLCVSKISQHTKIAYNEQGTEVICCTYESDDDMGFDLFDDKPPPPPPLRFIADHPFMFLIKEDVSDIVFFIGVVCDPLQEDDEEEDDKGRKQETGDDSDDYLGFSLFD